MMTSKPHKPTAKPSAAKSAPAASDLTFDTGSGPIVHMSTPSEPADSRAAQEFAQKEVIHATDCVLNSQCTLTTRECSGRLKATNPVSGKVQIYCPKCGTFASGTRPANGIVTTSGGKLFDRTGGK